MAEKIQFDLELNSDRNNEKTVGELREEFSKLEEQIDQTRQGTEEYNKAVRRIGEVQGELEKVDRAIEAMNPERKAQVIGDAVSGMAGGFQAAMGAVELFGVENEKVLQSLQRVNAVMAITEGITAFSEKIPAMKTLIATMPRLTTALKGARVGFQGLSMATKALGIGLLVSAVALLVTHWEDIKDVIADVIPGVENTAELFGKLTSAAKGVGTAILQFLAAPMTAVIQIMKGDFAEARDTITEGFNIIGNASESYANSELERQEELNKKRMEETIAYLERERELMEARGQDTTALDENIFEMKKTLYAEDSEEYKELIHQQNLADAQRTRQLAEEQRKRQEAYQTYLSDLEQARANTVEDPTDEIIELDGLEGVDTSTEFEQGDEQILFNGRIMSREEYELMLANGQVALVQQLETEEITRQEFRELQLENQIAQIEAEQSLFAEGSKQYLELEKERVNASMELANVEAEARVASFEKTGQALSQLSRLAGEQTVIGKALGVASAVIDTYVGANKALAQGGIFGIASAATVIATGLANVRQILSTKVPSIQGQPLGTPAQSPGGAPAASRVAIPPQFNETGINTVNTVRSERDRADSNRPVKAVVVETDITDTQNRVNEIERQSSF